MVKLYWNTVSNQLQDLFKQTMRDPIFDPFRLVGGTALSLYFGHRMSVDIDLFTDAPYGTIDFDKIESWLKQHYPYVQKIGVGPVGMGRSFLVGNNDEEAIKMDIYYYESFIRKSIEKDRVRLAHLDDIVAMKLQVIQSAGRKKDFWDLHEIIDHYSLTKMLDLHREKFPFEHNRGLLLKNLTNYEKADSDFEPICLKGKHWELIRRDIHEWVHHQIVTSNPTLQ